MTGRRVIVAVGTVALVVCTVLVFLAYDRVSHSNSDTIRPFVIVMVPVWVLGVVAARRMLAHGTVGSR